MNNFIVLDVETGGKEAAKNPITQIALQTVEPEDFTILGQMDLLVKPYNNLVIEKEALDYTRITLQQINELGVDVKLMFKRLLEAIKIANKNGRASNRPILVGHNISFDLRFLKYLFDFFNKDIYTYIDEVPFDTMQIMRWYEAGQLKSSDVNRYTLTACAERLGISLKSAHGAAADVEATKQMLIRLSGIMRNGVLNPKDNGDTKKRKKSREDFFFQF